jgi:uncharacterized Zn-finger protein
LTHSDKKPFVCRICGEGFCRNWQLKTHTSRHKGERSFICNVCGICFLQREIWEYIL